MDLTEINSDVDKLKELSNEQNDNESEFIKKYSKFIDEVVTKLRDNPDIIKKNKSKRKEKERSSGIEKIQNDINLILTKSNSFRQMDTNEKIRAKKKTELRIKKLCEEIYDVGKNTFNLDIGDVPEDEYHQLQKNRKSWFTRSLERISRGSSEYDIGGETEEEKKLKDEIAKMEKELEKRKKKLEQKKKQLDEIIEERKKKEKEEKEEKEKEEKEKEKEKEENENKDEENEEQHDEDRKIIEPITLLERIDDLLKDGDCRQAFELLNNTSLLGNRLLGAPKSKTPRMFIILPDPGKCPNSNRPNYWIKYSNWNKSVFNLLLLCECSGGIEENIDNETHLLDTTGYSIRDPYKLLSLFGPFLLYSIEVFMESCGDNYPREVIKALGKTKPADYFLSLSHEIQKVIKDERLVHKNEKKNMEALEQFIDVSRDELETFLKGYDYSCMFCGLDKRITRDKKIRWVCERHGRKFK
ncbi:hypothetical protein PIROE2DRAFT_56883 [Piromyces sp. E2]|nr:hypothetical protein PIROE2DRAFT_56883 [Piromyces sp. E2]|eukprot:OUM70194.1 hypothetical protein PIROE2DRAFT_56883 [Piromyces sp. E2]